MQRILGPVRLLDMETDRRGVLGRRLISIGMGLVGVLIAVGGGYSWGLGDLHDWQERVQVATAMRHAADLRATNFQRALRDRTGRSAATDVKLGVPGSG